MQLYPYLTFSGNCREAMTFYKACLGGKLTFQTVGESPLATKMPKKMKNSILHATLTREKLVLMGTDMVEEQGLKKGNAVSLSLQCNSEEEIKQCYAKLAAGGRASYPPENNFWGAFSGSLTDKFGIHWWLTFTKSRTD